MAALVDHVRYNDLPSLEEANVSRQVYSSVFTTVAMLTAWSLVQLPHVDDIINGPIRDVFLRHVTHLTLCLYLQHRHHTVGADEAVVKVEGTAHLMDGQTVKAIVSFGNKVVPATWMTSDGHVHPMEFSVVPDNGCPEHSYGRFPLRLPLSPLC
ncbi:MAG: hypothetical protein MMC33_005602 [Icmadophila ericetorum]|nr:hypothetical protein [Icmadophila ericetorum]